MENRKLPGFSGLKGGRSFKVWAAHPQPRCRRVPQSGCATTLALRYIAGAPVDFFIIVAPVPTATVAFLRQLQ